MIDQFELNDVICEGIKKDCHCECVKTNSTARLPAYDFVSFTVLNFGTSGGTSAVYASEDNTKETRSKEGRLTYSFTTHSDKDNASLLLAVAIHDWFEESGRQYLKDRGIVVKSVGMVTNRDNILTVGYEYRNGFDVVLTVVNNIETSIDIVNKAPIERGK